MKKLTYILHGLLFSAGSAVIIYVIKNNALIFIPPSRVILPTILSVALYFLILLVCYLLTRSLGASGLIASFVILGFFYMWPVFQAIMVVALVSLLVMLIVYRKLRMGNVHLVLNALSIGVFGYYLFQFVIQLSGVPRVDYRNTLQPMPNLPGSISSPNTAPDIYYLILDGYGRADMLQSVFGFDNSGFVDALENRGFSVASQSQPNYAHTLLSLSSSLNMQYLDRMSAVMGESKSWWPVMGTIQHSKVRDLLESQGYKTVFFASVWDFTDIHDGDYYEAPYPIMLDNFFGPYLNATNLKFLHGISKFGIAWPSIEVHRQIISYSLNRLPEMAKVPGPKFVFAHIMAAHPPFVFDQNGNPLNSAKPYTLTDTSSQEAGVSRYVNNYNEQVTYINQKLLTTIDGILANSNTPPIIILQADHGPGIYLNNNTFNKRCYYERYSILNAYYLPGGSPESVPADITPVNSFRFIFDKYFQADLEMLPNRQYYSPNGDIYHFTDVSGQTQEMCTKNLSDLP